MAHVTLIRPPLVFPVGSHLANHGTPPLGLAYLAGALKTAGHRVACIDTFGEGIDLFRDFGIEGLLVNGIAGDEIVGRIPHETDVIALSCMYSNEWIYTRELIHRIAVCFPGTPIIAGGEHVTADSAEVLGDCPEIVACALGEGEETIVALVEALCSRSPLDGVAGVVFRRSDSSLVQTAHRERIRDVNAIPWPSWDEIPIGAYLDRGLGFGRLGQRSMPILASRGCPYQCTFCSSPSMWTTRWTARHPDDVIDEIEHYITQYHIEHFDFYDLTAIVDRKWILRFCARLEERGVRLSWGLPSGTRSEALGTDVLIAMRRTGCCKVNYAPESGSEATLHRIKKRVKLDRMLASMRAAVKIGITARANLLIGLPGQTWNEVLEDFAFAVRLAWIGLHDIAVFAFVPYPGSDLFRDLVASGTIKRSDEYTLFLAFNVSNSPRVMRSWSEHIRNWQMPWIILGLMSFFYTLQFLFRPWRMVPIAYRLAMRKPLTTLEIISSEIVCDLFTGRKRVRRGQC